MRSTALEAERAAHRERLLAATEAELAKIGVMVEAGHLTDPAKIGVRVGKVINKRKVAKALRNLDAVAPWPDDPSQAV